MALIYNGITIPTNQKCIKYNNTALEKVVYNGATVWQYVLPITNFIPSIQLTDCTMHSANGEASQGSWGVNKNGSGGFGNMSDCSYATLKFIGKTNNINLNGYTKITIYVNEDPDTGSWSKMSKLGECTFTVAGTSYGITIGSAGHQVRKFEFAIPNNLGSKAIDFDINTWVNDNTQNSKSLSFDFKRITLSN